MSAQRNDRNPKSDRSNSGADRATQRSGNDWEKVTTQERRSASPDHDKPRQQTQDSWNVHQNPEHPERSADGGRAEMQQGRRRPTMRGNSGSTEQQSGDPESPDQPESGDRGRSES